jgi:Mor family transcriptional regulator
MMSHASQRKSKPHRVGEIPTSIQDIVDTLGISVALKLVRHFGGVDVKFPKSPSDDHPVIIALGKEDGLALCSFMGGGGMYVPHMRARRSVRRDVQELQDSGRDHREIARMLGISQRHVRRVANSEPQPTNQIDLFQND